MKTVAIITEYNPFHYGHLYQIERIKADLGEQTRIIAIMSGSFTQRGEIAIADKSTRAAAAIEEGVDLVLELPFPYCSSSAEFFAMGGVSILNSLGIVDYLVFGSECGDLQKLEKCAEIMSSDEYITAVSALQDSRESRELGYPSLCEKAFGVLSGAYEEGLFSPNNILAIEYIKALKKLDSSIKPYTIKRENSDYNDKALRGGKIQSASAIRPLFYSSPKKALEYIPDDARQIYLSAINEGVAPTEPDRLDSAVISFLRLNSPDAMKEIHDAKGGLYNRLHEISFEVNCISALMQQAETKRYTNSRIRRAIWNSYFGVTSSVIRSLPSYTQVLGMNGTGRQLLKEIKKKSGFPVITKPSSYEKYGDEVIRQKELSDKADSIFALATKKNVCGRFSLKLTPYVKKG